MKRVPLLYHMSWLSLLTIVLSACGSENVRPAGIDLTATSDQATQIYLCCTAVPLPTETPTPFPTASSSGSTGASDIVLSRGNPQRTGVYDNTEAIRQQPQIRWQTKVTEAWLMPPLVADGILYTGSGDGVLYALDAETGELIWSAEGFGQLESTGAIAGDVIVTAGFSNLVQALNRHTGDELWSFTTGYFVQGSPLIVDDRVYLATDHVIYALDVSSGELIWQTATGNQSAYMGPPAFDHDMIYTTGGRLLLALEAATGNEIWRVEKDEMFLGLAVANGLIYVGNWDHNFYAFDQSTGQELWQFPADDEFWSGPAVSADVVYTGNNDSVYALNAQTGDLIWTYKTGGHAISEPLLADGVVYVSDSAHEFPRGARHLYALDAATGEELWVFETVSTFLPAPALGEGVIYITSTGEVIALK